jgi:uncharacterized protein (DUF1330 family)
MAAFLIFSRDSVTDEAKSRRYSELVVPQIRQFGGEMVVARGKTEVLEGDWEPHSVTIVRFESKAALMAWWDSPEYAPLKQMRQESNTGDIIVVES